MASKNLLPVVALCGALATGTPVAAWATPVMADSLPAALSSAPNPSSAIACKRFSIAQAAISTSGCLRRARLKEHETQQYRVAHALPDRHGDIIPHGDILQ